MSLHSIPKVESADFYLDVAFRRAKSKAAKLSLQKKRDRIKKIIQIETVKIAVVTNELSKRLNGILKTFPSFEKLPAFYLELVKCTIEYRELKRSLAAVNWVVKKINEFSDKYLRLIPSCSSENAIRKYKREFYGRVSSAVKQIKLPLHLLEQARIAMKKFPVIKTSIPTIVIAGYPNVGKTTLLKALTGSAPKIASYPFTTQQLMIGYCSINDKKIQLIDTPGLLDRPLEKRNKIELQAILALKHIAKKILFLIDTSESCGYELENQISLLKQIERSFKVPIVVVLSKTDISEGKSIAATKKKLSNAAVTFSANNKRVIDKLKNFFNYLL